MVNPWGRRIADDEDEDRDRQQIRDNPDEDGSATRSHTHEPSERSRLLENAEDARDPSPYNLAVVRSLRNVTLLALFIGLVWWL